MTSKNQRTRKSLRIIFLDFFVLLVRILSIEKDSGRSLLESFFKTMNLKTMNQLILQKFSCEIINQTVEFIEERAQEKQITFCIEQEEQTAGYFFE